MYTEIKRNNGEVITFETKQYEVGTYVIINHNPSEQFFSELEETEFHKQIRAVAEQEGDVVNYESSSVIE